jgi:hypothetical protein
LSRELADQDPEGRLTPANPAGLSGLKPHCAVINQCRSALSLATEEEASPTVSSAGANGPDEQMDAKAPASAA